MVSLLGTSRKQSLQGILLHEGDYVQFLFKLSQRGFDLNLFNQVMIDTH